MIREPVWLRRPTAAEIAALRPDGTEDLTISGLANLWCVAAADGSLRDCQIDWQDPSGHGFGEAALKAAPLFRIAPTDKLGSVAGRPVEVRVSWRTAAPAGG